MADKRINALTTTSASVGDDYFAIDGATNGTRALSAFSPTFGGDPVVNGTLTLNGTSGPNAVLVNGNGLALNTTGSASVRFLDGPTTSKWWIYKLSGDQNLYIRDMVNSRMQMTFIPGLTSGNAISYLFSNLVVDSTASSTTTSTGALVVGNGTSGGLGVGGSINAGDNINSVNPQGHIQILGTGNTTGVKVINMLRSDGGDACSFGLTGTAYNGVFLAGGLGNNEAYIYNAAPLRVFIGTAATNRFDFTANQFKINPTTISNSTSSGALVVSGGVGVAGAIYAGGDIAIPADKGLYLKQGNVQKWTSDGTPTGTSRADIYADSGGAFFVRTGGATQALTISSSGNATFASTTNASSTSFAALVVSGGVGVAKRIVSGEGLTTNGDNETQITFTRNGTISIGPTSAATPKLAVGGGLQLSNTSQSIPAWGDVGAQLSIAGAVITDTTSSGTVSRFVSNSISASSVAASSPTTYTQAATLFIAAGPTANTNVTITNSYALFIAGGRINFGGLPTSSAGLQAGTLWNDGGTLKVA